jgi:xylan 1,4-beta-xylosidase
VTALPPCCRNWTLSDVFEEQGVINRPLYGGYGVIAEDGLPKPAFNAFKLLHRLGDRRVDLDSIEEIESFWRVAP